MYQELLNKLKEVEKKELMPNKINGTIEVLKELLTMLNGYEKIARELNCGCKK